ncbi:Imm26 family immunity protein [Paenibacillus cremeus]|uniref:Uncharacterized protein n=1 Tax=Paenibacillus cremeus TaxID=2163881 RepID=A0A559K6R7_9BACL|nr:Imm26 family immunity protein [Paenibacillus cremeus]TVY07832.1 hypothetical protein FPZ49_22000 [Paenibacillus cremeus]
MSKKKKIKPRLGDVFTFKLENGLYCYGQIVAPATPEHFDMLYVLYDYATPELSLASRVVNEPILAIANLVSGDIEYGSWTIIGNELIPADAIVLPDYVLMDESKGGTSVLRYDGTWVRSSSPEELKLASEGSLPNLRTWSTFTGGFEFVAAFRFQSGEWNEFYGKMLFKGSMWDAQANPDGMPLKQFLSKPIAKVEPEELIMIKRGPDLNQPPFFTRVTARERKLYVQEGRVGAKAKYANFNLHEDITESMAIENMEAKLKSDGYEMLEPEEYRTLTVIYPLEGDGKGTADELHRRFRIEKLLGEQLRETNNGDCNGGDISSGEMRILCSVVDPKIGLSTIQKTLILSGDLEHAKITLSE